MTILFMREKLPVTARTKLRRGGASPLAFNIGVIFMQYSLSPNWSIACTRNGFEYAYTFDSQLNIKPVFLKPEYIEQIKLLGKTQNPQLICNLSRLGIVNIPERDQQLFDPLDPPDHRDFLLMQAFDSRTPLECKIELTYNCNLDCQFCIEKGMHTKVHFTFEEIAKILIELRRIGTVKLFLTGGEVFLFPGITKIIHYACNMGFLVTVQTNATPMNEHIIRSLSVHKNLRINISFHSAKEEVFDSFVQVKGAWQRVVQNIYLLDKYNIKKLLIFNVTAENSSTYDDTIRWFSEHKYEYFINFEVYPNFMTGEDNLQYSAANYVYAEHVKKTYKRSKINAFENAECDAGIMKLRISPDGDVYPCGLIRKPMGNVRLESLETIWEGQIAKKMLAQYVQAVRPGCENCVYAKYCNKCNAMLINGNWNNVREQYCYRAKTLYDIYEVNSSESITD